MSEKKLNPYQLCMQTKVPIQRKIVDKKHPEFTPREAAQEAWKDASKVCKAS
jgi:hypothetical protein